MNTPDDSDNGYFVDFDLIYADQTKEKTNYFAFCPEMRKFNPDDYTTYMNGNKPKIYTQIRELPCDWTDNKIYLMHYMMPNLYNKNGMIVDKVHGLLSFKQRKWLKKHKN